MAIPTSNTTVAYYAQLLKGNYAKGVANLEFIMQSPATAQDLLNTPEVLPVIYGVNDRNSAALIKVMQKYGHGDVTLLSFLNTLLGTDYETLSALASSPEGMSAVIASLPATNAFASSAAAIQAVIDATTATYIPLAYMFESDLMFQAVARWTESYEVLQSSPSDQQAGYAVSALIGVAPHQPMSVLVASAAHMSSITESAAARLAVSVMRQGMYQAVRNITAVAAIDASADWAATLATNPRIANVEYPIATGRVVRLDTPVYIINQMPNNTAASSVNLNLYSRANGATAALSQNVPGATVSPVGISFTRIENQKSSVTTVATVTYKCIPCEL